MSNTRGKKTTGRFYAFLAVFVLLVVGIVVGIMAANGVFSGGGDKTASGSGGSPDATDELDLSKYADVYEDDAEDSIEVAPEDLIVVSDDDLARNTALPEVWWNVLLIGEDTRDTSKTGRSDTMIIASINKETGEVKLCSLLRDTIVDIPGWKEERLNAAHIHGGPNLLMKTINTYYGLNIKDWVSVNFANFPYIIDAMGGVVIPNITEDESKKIDDGVGHHMYKDKQAGLDWEALDNSFLNGKFGTNITLTGRQALGYVRIRSGDSDYYRTSRQRDLLNATLRQLSSILDTEPSRVLSLGTAMIQYVKTNITLGDMLLVAPTVAARYSSGIEDIQNTRLPLMGTYKGSREGSKDQALFDIDFEYNKSELYDFIYGSGDMPKDKT